MELQKLTLATLVAISTAGLIGCGAEGDNVVINVEDNDTTNTTTGGTTISTCPSFATPLQQDDDGTDVCLLPSSIVTNQTLSADTVWFMQSTVTVGNGNEEMSSTEGVLEEGPAVLEVTLTIEAGAEVKAATGTFAALVITRGSELIANGTANAPIIFSSDDDDYVGAGEWGGIVMHGYGFHNSCFDVSGVALGDGAGTGAACNVDAEGETGFAGGYTEDDSSGTLSYVIVTEGGYEFSSGNEINGISLVGVGSGTTLSYIQINDNQDDGIEFYGGSSTVDHIVLTGNQDDSVDWDEGFQGNLQYVLVLQSAATGGNSVEADTYGTSGSTFHSNPVVVNATFITNGDETEGHVLKAGSGGFFYNTVITPSPASAVALDECVFVDGDDAIADAGTQIDYVNALGNCTQFATANTDADAESELTVFTSTSIVDPVLDANYAATAAEATLLTALDASSFNADDNDVNSTNTANLTFLDTAGFGYIGAVEPGETSPWWSGWILEGSLPDDFDL